ncbi:hypothetical protein [Kitasatospora sp. NPDC087315]|uniref:hypothetical protein n=1 Tax=Kitasatospora sp. NPDC087315 TaxID=3364069 RepID=UPI0037FB6753
MPPRKQTTPHWQEVPGAQDAMDRALPLLAAVRAREYGPLAAVVFETALLFANADGLPDLGRTSHNAKKWMSDLLDAGGYKPVPGDSKERRERLAADRQAVLQGVRAAMSPIRVTYVRSMDGNPAERERMFPGLTSSDAIFAYYKIKPKAQSELRLEDYHRKAALQSIGAAALGAETDVPSSRGAEVVHTVQRAVAALTPASFASLDPQTRDQLRRELAETRAALLALEESLS